MDSTSEPTYFSKFALGGVERNIATAFSRIELESLPLLQWSALCAIRANAEPAFRVGTYLNIINASRDAGRNLDALAAVRRLDRETHAAMPTLATFDGSLQGQLTEDLSHLLARWSVVHSWRDPEKFNELIGHRGPLYCNYLHPGAPYGGILGAWGLPNNAARQGLQNASFHVLRDGRLFATVPLVADANHVLGGVTNHPAVGCLPAEICFASDAPPSTGEVRSIVAHVLHVGRLFGAESVLLGEPMDGRMLIEAAFDASHLYSCEIWTRPMVDLEQDEPTISSGVRKSYRSLINWGKNNLRMEYLTGGVLTDEALRNLYRTIQTLHTDIIGKFGDGMTTELYMFPMIACRDGRGEVALARDAQGEVVGMIVTSDECGVAYYALSGATKSQGKSVGHFLLFDAIVRARRRGNRQYALNRHFPAPVAVEGDGLFIRVERHRHLVFFKSGFSDDRNRLVVYRVRMG
jgi:hypothetical protein